MVPGARPKYVRHSKPTKHHNHDCIWHQPSNLNDHKRETFREHDQAITTPGASCVLLNAAFQYLNASNLGQRGRRFLLELIRATDNPPVVLIHDDIDDLLRRLDRVRLVVNPLELLQRSTLRLNAGMSLLNQAKIQQTLTRRGTT